MAAKVVSKMVLFETTLLSLLPNRLSMWGMRLALIPCTLEDIGSSLGLAQHSGSEF
jgi:hypothetical protein